MRNPKKQAVDEKLKSMACYLMKSDDWRPSSKEEDHGAPLGIGKVMPRARVAGA